MSETGDTPARVCEGERTFASDEDVGRLDVSVDDVSRVHEVNRWRSRVSVRVWTGLTRVTGWGRYRLPADTPNKSRIIS